MGRASSARTHGPGRTAAAASRASWLTARRVEGRARERGGGGGEVSQWGACLREERTTTGMGVAVEETETATEIE